MAVGEELAGASQEEDRAGVQAELEELLGVCEGHDAPVLPLRGQRGRERGQRASSHARSVSGPVESRYCLVVGGFNSYTIFLYNFLVMVLFNFFGMKHPRAFELKVRESYFFI